MTTREKVEQVLDYLNAKRYPATYGAVGKYVGVIAQNVGSYLGEPSPRASWIVELNTLLPSKEAGYSETDYHPDLQKRRFMAIKDGDTLADRISEWEKAGRP